MIKTFAIASLLFTTALSAQAITLKEAVEKAVTTNPDILELVYNKQAVNFEHRQAKSGYYPTVELDFSTGYERYNNSSTRTRDSRSEGDGPYRGLNATTGSVNVTQNLFKGFETLHESRRQYHRTKSAAYRILETADFTAMEAIRAYLDHLQSEKLLELSQENIAINKRYLEQMNERLKYKSGSSADVQQVQSRLSRALARHSGEKTRLSEAKASFKRIVGEIPSQLNKQNQPIWTVMKTAEDATTHALENHPSVKIAHQDVIVAKELAQKYKAKFFPTLDLELEASADKNIDGTSTFDSDYTAMISLSYDLYNGGKDIALYREHLKRLDEAQSKFQQAKMDVERNLYVSLAEYKNEKNRYEHYKDQEKASKKAWEAYQNQFNVGRRTLLDLLDSENELFTAKTNRVRSYYRMLTAFYQMSLDQGVLLSNLEIAPPIEAIK